MSRNIYIRAKIRLIIIKQIADQKANLLAIYFEWLLGHFDCSTAAYNCIPLHPVTNVSKVLRKLMTSGALLFDAAVEAKF